MIETQAIIDVQTERVRQDEKWGEQNRCPTAYIAICAEELGEATKHALSLDLAVPDGTIDLIQLHRYRTEMVQLAASATAAVEAVDRAKWKPGDLRSRNGKREN